jgi:hypothetical protein
MYGMDYDFDWVPPAPSPEKSPQDKALDEFIAKRKAKRDRVWDGPFETTWQGVTWTRTPTAEEKRAEDLDRAMSKLAPHEVEIHERVMPYRGSVL